MTRAEGLRKRALGMSAAYPGRGNSFVFPEWGMIGHPLSVVTIDVDCGPARRRGRR
jgi:hypothetical protein